MFSSTAESFRLSPHSFCKGRTLYSVVRDTKNTLDINKTRQIAQEIVKVSFFLFYLFKALIDAFVRVQAIIRNLYYNEAKDIKCDIVD